MLIALMSDIHANREAFSACLAHAASYPVDRYVFLGDYVGYGADPGWAVDTVMDHVERGAIALLGNHDEAISAARVQMNEVALAAIEWTRTRLDADRKSTRLNSSHVKISYAVFCLKKKKKVMLSVILRIKHRPQVKSH